MSAALPGLGQAYNKKYWKMPIIYAGLGATAYFFFNNLNEYNTISRHYEYLQDPTKGSFSETYRNYTLNDEELIRSIAQGYQTNYEWSAAGFVIVYALNIVDAMVDGYLFSFDVSKDLKGNWEPQMSLTPQGKTYYGAKISLKF